MKLREITENAKQGTKIYLPQFNKSDVNRGDLSTRVENMYEILKDISSELHNIRVSTQSSMYQLRTDPTINTPWEYFLHRT